MYKVIEGFGVIITTLKIIVVFKCETFVGLVGISSTFIQRWKIIKSAESFTSFCDMDIAGHS